MDHHPGHAPTPAEGPGPGYETRDADTRGIAVFATWLFAILVLVHLGLYGLYELFVHRRPPPPSVQTSDTIYDQLRSLRQAEDETLSTYGWVDRKAGVVRIPIDRAMELAARRGVPRGKGPRPEAEVNSHHGTPAEAETKDKDARPATPPEEKTP